MRRYSKKTFFIVVFFTALLLFISLFGLTIGSTELKGATQIRFGIDIRGGVEATYEPRDLDRMPTETELNAARAIIETRMDAANISDRDVTVDKSGGKIIVRFPWRSDETDFDPQKAVSELGETAMLTFRDPKGNIVLEGTDVAESYATINPSTAAPVVVLKLTEEGKVKFAEATKELAVNREPLSIYMDETEISSPIVDEPITDGNAIITGAGSLQIARLCRTRLIQGLYRFNDRQKLQYYKCNTWGKCPVSDGKGRDFGICSGLPVYDYLLQAFRHCCLHSPRFAGGRSAAGSVRAPVYSYLARYCRCNTVNRNGRGCQCNYV